MYRSLDSQKVVLTLQVLEKRIAERFPTSSLRSVCQELIQIGEESKEKLAWIARPLVALRVGISVLILGAVMAIVASVYRLEVHWGNFNLGEMLQILEATTNEVVLIGAAIFFLFTIESRVKRARSLKALYELRSVAHVIDMHQLTKDPSRDPSLNTASSPKVPMTRFQLIRYLDYCSEMLALVGKLAALYAQVSRDEVTLNTINEVESLCSNLTGQLWQKITILHAEKQVEEDAKAQPPAPSQPPVAQPPAAEAQPAQRPAPPSAKPPAKPKRPAKR
jgi:hypothetical protein